MSTITIAGPNRIEQLLEKHIEYRLATTEKEKHDIYRLRYRAYLDEGTIEPNPYQITTDYFDTMPNSWIIGIHVDGELTSSLRISVASPEFPKTPSMDVFPEMLKPELASGKVLVDPTRFVAEPDRSKRFLELPYITLRMAYVACEYFQADLGLASVRAEHQAFYRRVLMHPIAAPRNYPGLIKPIGLMAIDFPAMRDRVFARYPFLRSSPSERRKLFERPGKPRAEIDRHAMSLREATIAPRA